MFNNLEEVTFTHSIHAEYFSLINQFHNVHRSAIFMRYYHINKTASTYNPDTDGTFDKYRSGVIYDVYDYTPCFQISPLLNESQENQETKGHKFEGSYDVITYTMEKPLLGDLISFPYPPHGLVEIFRVTKVDVALSGITSNVNWFRLQLEYAAIERPTTINTLNSYVYLMTQQTYIEQNEYILIVEQNAKLKEVLVNIPFDKKTELFYYTLNEHRIAPLAPNKAVFEYFTNRKDLSRITKDIKLPYGILEYCDFSNKGYDLNEDKVIELNENNLPFIEEITNISTYEFNTETIVFDIVTLLTLYKG